LPALAHYLPARPEPSPLPLHDALPNFKALSKEQPILLIERASDRVPFGTGPGITRLALHENPLGSKMFYHPLTFFWLKQVIQHVDRKSTRLNSSHVKISYAVICLIEQK